MKALAGQRLSVLRKTLMGVMVMCAVTGAAACSGEGDPSSSSAASSPSSSDGSAIPVVSPPPLVTDATIIDVTLPKGIEDLRVLSGFADSIYCARIESIAQIDATSPGAPWTVFSVKVFKTLKGMPTEHVQVRQQGGEANGVRTRVRSDSLMEVGKTYIISTRGDDRTVVPVHGHAQLTSYDVDRLNTPEGEQPIKITVMEDAIGNAIPYSGK